MVDRVSDSFKCFAFFWPLSPICLSSIATNMEQFVIRLQYDCMVFNGRFSDQEIWDTFCSLSSLLQCYMHWTSIPATKISLSADRLHFNKFLKFRPFKAVAHIRCVRFFFAGDFDQQ